MSVFRCVAVSAIAVLLAATAQLALTSAAQAQSGDDENQVVAVVNGAEIRVSDVLEMIGRLPQNVQMQAYSNMPAMIERTIDLELILEASEQAGLREDPEVEQQVEVIARDVMRQTYLERLAADAVTETELQQAYDTYLEENPPEELRARHILVESETEAEEIIGQLDGGADFAELAREKSTGPTGENGGDLGYFQRGQMVAPFADAAFGLESGAYTPEPVQTQFGWHVILVEDKRTNEPPSMEDLEPQLRQQLEQEAIQAHLAELRSGAEIEVVEPEAPAGPGDTPPAE
ncbi:peptidylprolyl isomerase [Algihabitans albus]|uniref:peptidylprolyl isomerase n=1 Tax=Algihabitans albus TaxID=2164067 RepID=UPI000E5D5F68|nr:peptidylprolyl isomerase [Algihabitans albus]